MAGNRDEDTARSMAAARKGAGAALPKRFYVSAEVREFVNGFAVALDGKPIRTPGRRQLIGPGRPLAEAMTAEWSAQLATIDPATMPMTRLVNSAIDGVAGHEGEVAADIAKYAGSDLVCYRAGAPAGLVALQNAHWDPVLAWADTAHNWRLVHSTGVVHVAQPAKTLAGIAEAVARYDALALAGLHSMTTLMGSVLLALAVAERHLAADAAWMAAHVDEDFQISQWGADAEAAARRAFRWRDMQAAAMLVEAN